MSDDKFVVIGSNSFSGAHFVNFALGRGAEVAGISRSAEPVKAFLPYKWKTQSEKFKFFQLDLNKKLDEIAALLSEFKPSYIVNFAAQSMVAESWQNPEQWYQTNVVANVKLFEVIRKFSFLKKYVHISTPEVYGSCQGTVPENTVYNPSTPYAVSRAACDMHLMMLYKNYGFPVAFTRSANVYGPGQQLYRIVPRTVMFIKLGKKLQLHGGGHSVRSFIHAADVAAGTYSVAVDALAPAIYHFSTKRFISIRDLVEMICVMMGKKFEDCVEISEDRPGKDSAYLLDTAKAEKDLGWKPEIDLEAGVKETVKWIEENFDILKQQPLNYIHKP